MTQAFPSPSSEDDEAENRNIIWKTTTCPAENCTGWLMDSFAGKYFIKCEDPKHNAVNNDDNDNEEVEKEGKISHPSQFPDLNLRQTTIGQMQPQEQQQRQSRGDELS